ncbi:glycosyltransferase family 4 protein [Sporolactobacillus pectinivorans]|uniref:glycosyltransferase family 4 protein n=1 Tax=Sporolactobacillus pectinivorans TaxID=1591408 RepID=UPI001EFCDB94|nr:glycosyltransferase family 4 protein [Sporolactobacillus pectinivorans]
MKLALICTEKLPAPAVRGGAIQIMIDGISPFLSFGHELTVFSITDLSLPRQEERNHVRYIRFPRESYTEQVTSALTDAHFDVVHVFNRPQNLIRYKAAAPESNFVLSLHNDMFSTEKISVTAGQEAIRCSEKIMTVSHYIQRTTADRFPESEQKLEVVYSGIDPSRFHPQWTPKGRAIREQMRSKYQLGNKKIILFAGRLCCAKGPHLLIRAMKYIIDSHPDAVLVIAGGKWFADNDMNHYVRILHRLAEPLGNHVLFTGFIPADRIPDLFTMADLFVCSSQWQEPLARVHYEAMAAGLPIITTNRGGNSEVMHPNVNGLVVNDYDRAGAYAAAIDFILSNGYSAKIMGHNGRKQAATSHRFSQVANHLERIYLKACRPAGQPNQSGSIATS